MRAKAARGVNGRGGGRAAGAVAGTAEVGVFTTSPFCGEDIRAPASVSSMLAAISRLGAGQTSLHQGRWRGKVALRQRTRGMLQIASKRSGRLGRPLSLRLCAPSDVGVREPYRWQGSWVA